MPDLLCLNYSNPVEAQIKWFILKVIQDANKQI